jgi:hypothetical protein
VEGLDSLVEEPKDERPIQYQLLQPQLDIDPQGLFDVEQPDGVVLRDLAGVFAHRYRLCRCLTKGEMYTSDQVNGIEVVVVSR